MKIWPEGNFGLPQPVYGCPDGAKFPWLEGKLSFTLPENGLRNIWTEQFHLLGPYNSHQFTLAVCTKLQDMLPEEDIAQQPEWPRGSYCIYKMEKHCPKGTTC